MRQLVRLHRPSLRSVLLLGLLSLVYLTTVSCEKKAEGTLELEAGTCNPRQLLTNNPNYARRDLKLGLLSHPYNNLFARGFERGCMVSMWSGQSNAEDNQPYAKALRVEADGSFTAIDSNTKEDLLFDVPDDSGLKDLHFRLYFLRPDAVQNVREHKDLCRLMQRTTYRCFDNSNQKQCWFYLKLYPKDKDKSFTFGAGNSDCRLCSPELCNGKDDDCDGTIDNVYSTKTLLSQSCFTGPGDALVDGNNGKGECITGNQRCDQGSWQTCVGQVTPKKETCNGKDDDCDGRADNGGVCPTGQICLDGSCQLSPCRPGETPCNSACVNLNEDAKHCGGCNTACKDGERCASGKCVTSCPSSTSTVCGSSCIDVQSNRNHCGACNNTCADGQICFGGQCVLSCPKSAPACGLDGQKTCCSGTCCNDTCLDLQSNSRHCGACNKPCAGGSLCFQGQCVLTCPDSAPLCGPTGQKTCCPNSCCNGACIDTQTNPTNCGSCGNACPKGQVCSLGHCKLSCPNGTARCGTTEKQVCCDGTCCNNACINIQTDRRHCGACNILCPDGHVCVNGQCVLSCPQNSPKCGPPGQEVCCPGACCNNRCVDTKFDPQHCGQCNQGCTQGQACVSGQCQFACPPAQKLCGTECVNIQVNPLHCGGCNKACGTNERCDNSTCRLCPSTAPACGPAGQKNCCSLNCCGDACVDTQTNPQHCGFCGNACQTGEYCQAGTCKTCPGTLSKCGASCCNAANCCNNTCVDTQTNPLHCGACGTICGKGQTCCLGRCVDLSGDSSNCGSCNKACTLGQSCSAGNCCTTGQQWCGQQCIDPLTDNNHCGGCGVACSNTTQCTAGKCECRTGTTRCNGECANLQISQRHCGACNNACQGGMICNNSTCVCPANTTLCNNICTDTQTSPQHCGQCNKACTSGQVCNAGQCQ